MNLDSQPQGVAAGPDGMAVVACISEVRCKIRRHFDTRFW
jgi:hypothetical protein